LSVAQVYIGFKAGTELPDLGDILFTSSEPDFDDRASTAFPPPSRSYSIYYPRHLRPDHDRAEIVASARSRHSDWTGLSREGYAAKKGALAESVLADLERHFPDVRERIDHLETATPMTLARYTGHWDGASFGTKFPGYLAADRLPKEVPGLYHTGSSGIIMSGWLGAANNGALVAAAVDRHLGRV